MTAIDTDLLKTLESWQDELESLDPEDDPRISVKAAFAFTDRLPGDIPQDCRDLIQWLISLSAYDAADILHPFEEEPARHPAARFFPWRTIQSSAMTACGPELDTPPVRQLVAALALQATGCLSVGAGLYREFPPPTPGQVFLGKPLLVMVPGVRLVGNLFRHH
jgi:hypothetical protein